MKQSTAANILASAYLSSQRAPRALRIIKLLCYIGLSIGSCALLLALIITHGFEQEIGIKMKGISSDAIIEAPGSQINSEELSHYLREKVPYALHGVSASSTRHLIVTHKNSSRVVFLRGINGADEQRVTTLESKITAPHAGSLATLLRDNNALIVGKQFALNNMIWLGSELTVYVPQETGRSSVALEKKTMYVAGIFSVGLEDYDVNVAYCNSKTLQSLYENCSGADQVAVSFKRPSWDEPATSVWDWCSKKYDQLLLGTDGYYALRLQELVHLLPGLSVRSWQQLYPDLVASLALEKYAISLVLALIALVASMLMICLLFMFMQYKQVDIAILRTMGMSNWAIYTLFMRIGMTIIYRSIAIGITAAWSIGWYIKTYQPITLPEVYYIAYLPAALEPLHILVVAVGTWVLGVLACQIPLWQLHRFSVVSLLRGE